MDLLKDYMMKSSSFKENSPFLIFYLFYVKDGYLEGTPFSVLFGKKDIWLPRSGHIVSLKVNGEVVPVSMTLNSEGQAYFSTLEVIEIFDIHILYIKNLENWFFGTKYPFEFMWAGREL